MAPKPGAKVKPSLRKSQKTNATGMPAVSTAPDASPDHVEEEIDDDDTGPTPKRVKRGTELLCGGCGVQADADGSNWHAMVVDDRNLTFPDPQTGCYDCVTFCGKRGITLQLLEKTRLKKKQTTIDSQLMQDYKEYGENKDRPGENPFEGESVYREIITGAIFKEELNEWIGRQQFHDEHDVWPDDAGLLQGKRDTMPDGSPGSPGILRRPAYPSDVRCPVPGSAAMGHGNDVMDGGRQGEPHGRVDTVPRPVASHDDDEKRVKVIRYTDERIVRRIPILNSDEVVFRSHPTHAFSSHAQAMQEMYACSHANKYVPKLKN